MPPIIEVPQVEDDVAHRAFLKRLRADLKTAAATLSEAEARYLVDLYYQQQENRKRSHNQVRSTDEPNALVAWLAEEHKAIETTIKMAMDAYTDNHLPARWMKSLTGVGPVLAAGFFATIDITKAKTAGSVWRFAGLDPSRDWMKEKDIGAAILIALGKPKRGEKLGMADVTKVCALTKSTPATVYRDATTDAKTGANKPLTRVSLAKALARRPWNARLKVLSWKFSDCQKKFQNNPKSYYGPLYAEYKANLVEKNERGEFAETAKQKMQEVGKSTDAYKHFAQGKLSPGLLDNRALRWTSKLFLSHLHTVMWVTHYGTQPVKPYAVAHLGHAHEIAVPNWPMV